MPEELGFITWFGHASFMLSDQSTGNSIYYIDPFEFSTKQGVSEKADIVFITHAHFDHCDSDSVGRIMKPDTVIVAPDQCRDNLNLNNEFLHVKPDREYKVKGFRFRTVPAYNTKQERLEYHPRSNNWVGYVFQISGKTIYHAGDTDFTEEMKSLGKIDVAILPIGGTYTMDVDEAIQAANAIAADITIPMHYRRLLGNNYKEAEERFRQGVKNSKVAVMEEVA